MGTGGLSSLGQFESAISRWPQPTDGGICGLMLVVEVRLGKSLLGFIAHRWSSDPCAQITSLEDILWPEKR